MTDRIYPLTFVPVFRDYIWGGRSLERLFGRQLPPGIIAESWDISGHPSSPTQVADGFWEGRTLPQVVDALGSDLLGRNGTSILDHGRFPLLVKLLDANADLSVQVHPGDAYARIHEGGELGKTEMWYILHARPGAELIYGLRRGANPSALRDAIARNEIETQLHRLRVQAGDTIFLPAGTVHALLAGLVVAEIQQNSDTTYRLHDWGRLGPDGAPRPLHIDKALDVIDWDHPEPGPVQPRPLGGGKGLQHTELVHCSRFVVEHVALASGATYAGQCDGSTFEIWGCVEGATHLHWSGQSVTMRAVRFVLLPAALGSFSLQAERPSVLLRAYLPPPAAPFAG